MKRFALLKLLALGLIITVATTGCRSRTKGLTPIPGGPGAGKTGTGITDDTGPKTTYTPSTTFTPPGTGVTPPPQAPDNSRPLFPPPPPNPSDLNPAPTPDNVRRTGTGIAAAERGTFEGMIKDAQMFRNNTVHFDYDSSVIKQGERGKIESVASYLKTVPANKILIEGHCDERGTEEYNRALGERRALAVREYLEIGRAHV